jgi:hypothetical protein
VEDERFPPQFLDKLAVLFASRPSATDATIDLDESQIEQDTRFIQSHKKVATGLRSLVAIRHAVTIETRLNPARTAGFEAFPRFRELFRVAEHGAIPHFKPGFQCNRGEGDFLRPQARVLRAAIRHQYGKLHRKGWCILLPKALVQGVEGLHISPTHVAYKRGDTKGRCCVDHTASGLNDGIDMSSIEDALGQLSLPGLKDLAILLYDAHQQGARCMFKTDVASAFNRVKLSYAAVLSQATQVDNLVLFPLVAVFGWTASPMYYSLVSDAVNWAHNGGVAGHTLDGWRRDQGKEVPSRGGLPTSPGRVAAVPMWTTRWGPFGRERKRHHQRMQTPSFAGCSERTPEERTGTSHYRSGMVRGYVAGTMRPSDRGIQKMFWWCFRKARSATKSSLLQDLQSLVSLLRWYSAVIPMAMGALGGLTALLGTALRARQHAQWVRLDGASQRDLAFWRWLLAQLL